MLICVLADDQQKEEFLQKGIAPGTKIIWADTLKVLSSISDVDVYFDLQYTSDAERLSHLRRVRDRPVFVNDVIGTLKESDPAFIRINAWPTMLSRSLTEIAVNDPSREKGVEDICRTLGWTAKFVPDIAGMITPRIISMIINEAYFTLEQGVSTRDEIDTAMKLGTNYPFGPFEWSDKIGLQNIYLLLDRLSKTDLRYSPCELLAREAERHS